jgi:glycosyltransferase involved in cell wall biosynthesis
LPSVELSAPPAPDELAPRFSPFGHPGGPLWRRALRWLKRKAAPAGRLLAPPLVYDLARRTRDRLRRASRPGDGPPLIQRPLPEGHVVFTFVFNPCDGRKAWREVLTAFVTALGDREDASLVLKFACPPRDAADRLPEVLAVYEALAHRRPRCRVLVIDRRLDDEEMGQLIASTTWYVNGSRAEGCCLPLLEAMAAGRPALSPTHTAMGDYFTEKAGLVLDSEEEPTHWPGDHTGRLTTTWHRLSWWSLCRGLSEAYHIARSRPELYGELAAGARAAARAWAAEDVVEARLRRALAAACRAAAATNREVA